MNSTRSHRAFYARLIVNRAGSANERLIDAFATVERERFVGPGPWSVFTGSGYISTITDDPKVLYQDILVGIASDRGINNGEPSLHARAIAACDPKPGEQVVHVGAGTGYYTAVLAHMVASAGRVIGYEIEADLAGRASSNLAGLNATVAAASGTHGSLPPADVIYVSAGATHPVRTWLEALNPNGRLLFPLTPDKAVGAMLLIERRPRSFAASVIGHAAFIPCIGARDEAESASIAVALASDAVFETRSLRLDTAPDSTALCVGGDWWLSSADEGAFGSD